jgi:protein gp37
MHPAWARQIRDACTNANVPFYFKQWGEWAPENVCATRSGAASAQYIELDGTTRPAQRGARGDAVTVQRNGKGNTGRRLDGRTWDEFPAEVTA